MTEIFRAAKNVLAEFRVPGRLSDVAGPDCAVQLAHPFETMDVAGYHGVLDQLAAAFPDLERRVTIEVAGHDANGQLWVGQFGYWCGLFDAPCIGIPATRRLAASGCAAAPPARG